MSMIFGLISFLVAAEPAAADAGIRQVIAAVADAAKENLARPEKQRVTGDALADLYIRNACEPGLPPRTILLGIAYALDPNGSIAGHPFAAGFYEGVEAVEARKERWKLMGKPTLRGREDWLYHFVVSAGLTAAINEPASELFGIQKEVADAIAKEKGKGSGFSFTDLSANFAGIAFARWLISKKSEEAVAEARKRFSTTNFAPDPKGLPDGLTWSQFMTNWGSTKDPRFQSECESLRKRVNESPGYLGTGNRESAKGLSR